MSAVRHVLMTADASSRVFSAALELAGGLAGHGVRVTLATMGGLLSAVQRRAAAGVPGLSLFESAYRLEHMDDAWEDVQRGGAWLAALERRIRPDIVHLGGFAHGALPLRAPAIVAARSSLLAWHEAVHGGPTPPRYERYRREAARGVAAAAAVVAPTRASLEAIARLHGPITRGVVIPHAADPRRFRAAPTKQEIIVSLGRLWDPAKNIAALSAVASDVPWPICVGGSINHPTDGLSPLPALEHLGVLTQREVASVLGHAAIYAHPARYEPFGVAILEAALSGCALVLGDLPSLREVWGDEAACYVPPEDPEALGAALRSLVGDPEARAEMGKRARDRALRYSPSRMVRGYLDLYTSILSSGAETTLAGARS